MTGLPIADQAAHAIEARYTQEPPVTMFDAILNDVAKLDPSLVAQIQPILARHLTFASMAADVADAVAAWETSPAVRAVEQIDLTPNQAGIVGRLAADLAGALPPALPAPPPAPAPAVEPPFGSESDPGAADPGPAGLQVGGVA